MSRTSNDTSRARPYGRAMTRTMLLALALLGAVAPHAQAVCYGTELCAYTDGPNACVHEEDTDGSWVTLCAGAWGVKDCSYRDGQTHCTYYG